MLMSAESTSPIAMEDDVQPPTFSSAGMAAARGPDPIPSHAAQLVRRMAQGDQQALAELYDTTSPLINGLLLRILEHAEDAEEVLLDVYMKAWKNAAAYSQKRGSVQAWLIIMARNTAIDRIRHRRAQPRTVGIEPETGFEFPAPEASPEMQTAAAMRRRRVQRLLQELPPEQREAVVLAFFGGLSHAELAERLNEPLGTIKSRIRMGLIRLRALLEEGGDL